MRTYEQIRPILEKMTNDQEMKLFIAREIFMDHDSFKVDSDWDAFVERLSDEDKSTLGKVSHFYYFICQPFAVDSLPRDELVLIAITSIVEKIMATEPYKDFFSWCESEGITQINDLPSIQEQYLGIHGLGRKFRGYFETYLSPQLQDELINSIVIYREKPSLKRVAQFLYARRSKIVHESMMRSFSQGRWPLGDAQDGKVVTLRITVNTFRRLFETSFLNFWLVKAGLN